MSDVTLDGASHLGRTSDVILDGSSHLGVFNNSAVEATVRDLFSIAVFCNVDDLEERKVVPPVEDKRVVLPAWELSIGGTV